MIAVVNNNASRHEKLVLVKGSGGGGIGDRLRAVLVALLYAKCTGRSLSVDWRDSVYSDGIKNAFTELFELNGWPYVPPEHVCSESVYPPAWQNRLQKSMDTVYCEDGTPPWNRAHAIQTYSFDMSQLNYEQDVLVSWEFDQLDKVLSSYSSGYSETAEAALSRIYQIHFKPSREIADCARRFVEEQLRNKIAVGVHVRDTEESRCQRPSIRLNHYYQAVDRLIKRCRDGIVLFLSTDNPSVVRAFQSRYKNLVTRDKWFPESGQSLHLNAECPDRLIAAKDAVIELQILATCEYLITRQDSSFSTLARIMSKSESGDRLKTLVPRGPILKRALKKFVNV